MGKNTGLLFLSLMALPGCTTAWAIDGALIDAGETLTGAATRYADGGTIEVFGSRGTHCTGIFTALNAQEGKGRLLCDDRRSGPFLINMQRKAGHGDLNGRGFTFTLANPRAPKPQPKGETRLSTI